MDGKWLLREYEKGLDYRRGDKLTPRPGANPDFANDCEDREVVVLKQSPLAPHQYEVIGKRVVALGSDPAERFIRFDINGHQWQLATNA